MSKHVVVIGIGIIGACTSLALLADGHRVTMVEPETPGGEQAASYGNGAWISPASVVPMSMPGLWRRVPSMLMDPLGPLTIRPRALPGLLPWLLRFLAAGSTEARVERIAGDLATLLRDAPARHQALADSIGQSGMIRRTGLLYAYPDRQVFTGEALAWRLRRENGVAWRELDAEALRAFEPRLAPHYRFGALVEAGAHCQDPGAYVAALARAAVARGAMLVRARALDFRHAGKQLTAVMLDQGDIACDAAVIAAGIHAAPLAVRAGDPVPLASERGYHVVVPDPGFALPTPVMPSDGKMANTSTPAGLRASGQVELAAVDAPPNWARAKILLDHLVRTYPDLPARKNLEPQQIWMGHRPSTPDGRPVIGEASALAGLYHAFGHGHIGLATGPITAQLVADLLVGRSPVVPVAPFSPRRFRRRG
jgi:D-amino-acid dehydrogenase